MICISTLAFLMILQFKFIFFHIKSYKYFFIRIKYIFAELFLKYSITK